MIELLHNIVWHALVGAHARFAAGSGGARRYQRGVTDLVGFADAAAPDFAALRACCEAGERFYCLGWTGPVPAGWAVEREARIVKMVWDADTPPSATDAPQPSSLTARHHAQAMALAELTQPGPFGRRTLELGDYIGAFEGDALIAMAGERMQAERLREISAVCTHPRHQGRGLARSLMLHLIRNQLGRGETPFLHVMAHNQPALGLYRKMGFRVFAESSVRIVRVA
jgi:GNAT superfamily N-acetyltransferase